MTSLWFYITRILIALLTFCTLYFDYFITNEFNIESNYLIFASVLILTDTALCSLQQRGALRITISIIILIGLGFQFLVLLFCAFGYSFMGASYSYIWFIGLSLNILYTILTILSFPLKKKLT